MFQSNLMTDIFIKQLVPNRVQLVGDVASLKNRRSFKSGQKQTF